MKIREFLTEANWGKGREIAFNGKHCLSTAICRCYELSSHETVGNKILGAIGRDSIMVWNDAPERTFAEVKALVEKLDV